MTGRRLDGARQGAEVPALPVPERDPLLEEQKRYYAARAPEYDDWWYKRGRYAVAPEVLARWHADIAEADAALEAFAAELGASPAKPTTPSGKVMGGSVLELAAGTGLWTRKLVRFADSVVAVDANPETLALNTNEAEHVLADIFEWCSPEAFDVVFFSFWLSHVPEERFDDFWRTVRAALAPGGRVFLIDSGPREVEPGDDRPGGARNAPRGVRPGVAGLAGDASSLSVRQLADGREFRIVKKFWRPDELAARAGEVGFDLDLRLTANGNFLYGFGS